MECVICWKNIFVDFFDGSRISDRHWSTACKHYWKYVIYRYLHNELIWCLFMVQYLQNNVIMKWITRFIRFTGWIPLKYGSTTTPPIIAHCKKNLWCKASYFTLQSQNLQYKTHPKFWPSHRWIFKTSLYYKTQLILENWWYCKTSNISNTQYQNFVDSRVVLQLLLLNPLKPGVKSRMNSWNSADRWCSNYIWVINNIIAY